MNLSKSKLITILLVLSLSTSYADSLSQDQIKIVTDFQNTVTDAIDTKNKKKLINLIWFPLKRSYPLPSVKSSEEFESKISEVFDTHLINLMSVNWLG